MGTTRADLIAQAKDLADMANTDFVEATTWNTWANDGIKALQRDVVSCFKDTFFRTENFTLSGSTYSHTLPSDFQRVKGVDIDADTPRRRTVRRFNFQERNSYRYIGDFFTPLLNNVHPFLFYNVVGSNILQIQPQERASGSFRLYYVPKPTLMATDGSTLDPELEPYSEYVALFMAINAANKEESFDTANALQAKLNQIRQDMLTSLETDEGPATIVDVNDR
jgi:hypothetical protein